MHNTYPIHKTEAFILWTSVGGEADRQVHLITEAFGTLTVLAKSIRKEEAKMRTVVLPYQHVRLSFVVGKRNILKDISVKDPLIEIWAEQEKYVAYVSLLRYMQKHIPMDTHLDDTLYAVLVSYINQLKNGDRAHIPTIELVAKNILLSLLGYVDDESISFETFDIMLEQAQQSKDYRAKLERTLAKASLHH